MGSAVLPEDLPRCGSESRQTTAEGLFRFVNPDPAAVAERKDFLLTARHHVAADFQLQLAGRGGAVSLCWYEPVPRGGNE
jgi:hypothetical protein